MGDARSEVFDELAVVGKAFASAKRLEIVELLGQRPYSVDEIAHATGQGVSSVSAHLQILRAARLVTSRRQGTRVFYRLAGDDVAELFAMLGAAARTHSPDVTAALDAYVGSSGDGAEVPRGQLTGWLTDGQVTLMDVRPAEEYEAAHIPGARSMPLGDLVGLLPDLPADGLLVAYCRGAFCVMASDAVTLLRDKGREARRMAGGMLEWRLDGLPVEAGVQP